MLLVVFINAVSVNSVINMCNIKFGRRLYSDSEHELSMTGCEIFLIFSIIDFLMLRLNEEF